MSSINMRCMKDKRRNENTYKTEGDCLTCGRTSRRSRNGEEEQQQRRGRDESDDESDVSEN
jgi:hypothetical protein